jgi:carboxylate-amine ligase
MLNFKNNAVPLTLGVEMELQVLDQDTLQLAPKAHEIMLMLNNEKLTKEMFRSTIEIITGICSNVQEVSEDLRETVNLVCGAGLQLGLRFSGTGTNPEGQYTDRIVSPSERYSELLDRNQWLIKRMAVYGLHIHIGMRSGEECIRFYQFFMRFVPHFIILSGSSPFWRGMDTGLNASRPTVYEALPTAGLPYLANDWNDFNRVYDAMLTTKSIQSMKDIWWDIRPSPGFGTLELRMCDGPATMVELEAIVAFAHLLSHWFDKNGQEYFTREQPVPERWVLRENKWRAIRHGTEADIIDNGTLVNIPFKNEMEKWVDILTPLSTQLGYQNHLETLMDIVYKGNSSTRQRRVMTLHNALKKIGPENAFDAHYNLKKVSEHNVAEFEKGSPFWSD